MDIGGPERHLGTREADGAIVQEDEQPHDAEENERDDRAWVEDHAEGGGADSHCEAADMFFLP